MLSPVSLAHIAVLGTTFLYSLILLVSSLLKKNKTMLTTPFLVFCAVVTLLQLDVLLEWLWLPGVYPKTLYKLLFVLEYLLSSLSAAALYWYAKTYFYSLSHSLNDLRPPVPARFKWLFAAVAIAAVVLFSSSLGNGWLYRFDAEGNVSYTMRYPIVFSVGAVWPVMTLVHLLRSRKQIPTLSWLVMLCYIILPSIGFIVDLFLDASFGCVLAAIVFFMIYTHVDNVQGDRLLRQRARLAQQEAEMAETQMELMMSQIQPHFLYNALSSIAYLCTEDPEEAERATNEFSSYLKGNLRYIGAKTPIAFEIELNHVKQYLNIEKRRFSDRLKVVYDIAETDFLIPALAMQTLVENAVRYGVNARYDPTTVTIRVRQTASEHQVQIIDDGPGFDPGVKPGDDRRHIGLDSARYRLQEMVGGSLEIASTIGTGTTVTIHIPKEGMQ